MNLWRHLVLQLFSLQLPCDVAPSSILTESMDLNQFMNQWAERAGHYDYPPLVEIENQEINYTKSWSLCFESYEVLGILLLVDTLKYKHK